MDYQKDTCKKCGKVDFIVNRTFYLCDDCNCKRLHGKSRSEKTYENFKKQKIYRIKTTGEKSVFEEIWAEREHICHNCKAYLGDEMRTHFFMHMRAKGAHPSLRLNKENIELGCPDCHTAHDHIGVAAYNKRKDLYANVE